METLIKIIMGLLATSMTIGILIFLAVSFIILYKFKPKK